MDATCSQIYSLKKWKNILLICLLEETYLFKLFILGLYKTTKVKGLAINLMILILSIGANAESILNVRDFGAKGDGTTDDTKAIQSAINNASPILMTTIYFPKGIYNIASYTTTTNFLENYCLKLHSNLSIKGDGDGSIIDDVAGMVLGGDKKKGGLGGLIGGMFGGKK